MTPEEQNFQSRIESLDILFNRLKSRLNELDPYTAIDFTTPLQEILLAAVMQLENYKEEKRVDNIIDSALNQPNNE